MVAAMLAMALPQALAAGVSAVPGTIDVDDALRGSTLFRTVTLYNDTASATPFLIDFEGEAGLWMTAVDPEDRTVEISEAFDEDGSGAVVGVRIDVPADVESRAFEGVLRARLAPPETDDGLAVGLGLKIVITLDVTGDQVIAATLTDVSLRDTEVGAPARVQAAIDNTGNTQVVPEFTLEILRDGSPVSKTTTASVPSFPGEEKTFEIRWDTTSAEPGSYVAALSVNFGGLDLGTTQREFTLHPSGTIDQILVFASLESNGEPRAGGLAGFTATIQNPGQIDAIGTLVGELSSEEGFVSAFESQQFTVKPGQILPIPINIETPEEGNYEFTAHVEYGDTQTDTLSLAFVAVTAPTADTAAGDSSTGATLLIAALVLALGLGVAAWLLMRSRGNRQPVPLTDPDPKPDLETADAGTED
jgi:hypothetical protein